MANRGTSSASRNASGTSVARAKASGSKTKTTKKTTASKTTAAKKKSSSSSSRGKSTGKKTSSSRAASSKTAAKKTAGSSSRTGSSSRSSAGTSSRAGRGRTASYSGGRAAAAGRQSSRAAVEPMNPGVKTDIYLTLMLLFCVLLLMSNFGIGGPAGKAFASFFFGLFGFMAYLFPLVLFLLAAFYFANRDNPRRDSKLFCYILFYMFVCAFVHMLTRGYSSGNTLISYYTDSSFDRSGGGLLGGIVVFLAGKAFGRYGCYVISVFGMIITLCFATQKPLVSQAAERGLLARERLQALREKSLNRKTFLPYDEEEYFEEFDDDGGEDFEDEEIRPFRRSGKVSAAVPRPERERRTYSSSDGAGGEQLSFSDSFLFSLNKMEEEEQNKNRSLKNTDKTEISSEHKKDRKKSRKSNEIRPFDIFDDEDAAASASAMNSQDLFELFDPEEEAAERNPQPGRHSSGTASGQSAAPSRSSVSFAEFGEDVPELTINKSEGAAAMEQEQLHASYDSYRDPSGETSERGSGKADSVSEVSAGEEEGKARRKKKPRSSEEEIAKGVESIDQEIGEKEEQIKAKPYQFPPMDLLKKGSGIPRGDSTKYLKETAASLKQVFTDFHVDAEVVDVSCGPSVTRFEVRPEHGVKVKTIVALSDDIMMRMAASNIRIEAPIPGKAAVGIEIPNKTVAPVLLRDLLESQEFINHPSKIAFAVGKDIAGKTVVTDIARMPHLLIAGATGSGKSVCINTLIMSILYKASPDEVKLLMIDPKVVELSVYNGIPHLAIPVVTDPKKAAGALNWAVAEMSDRYNKFAEYGVRDVAGYNAKVDALKGVPEDQKPKKMPQIVIVVDELADLMMVAPGEVEDAICRLAQLARAAGIHLIIATQRPSVNVVTGLIKANMPSRIALSVASGVDSRTILDMNGAEKLLGHGDMLFYPQGYTQPARVQGGYVSDEEISAVVDYLAEQHGEVSYDASIQEKINSSSAGGSSGRGGSDSDQDELFIDAAKLIVDKEKASIGMLQRQFKIGFNRAARIMDQLCDAGVVGAEEGTKPRKVLLSKEQFENYVEEGRL